MLPAAIWHRITDGLPVNVFLFYTVIESGNTWEEAQDIIYGLQAREQKRLSSQVVGRKGIYIE